MKVIIVTTNGRRLDENENLGFEKNKKDQIYNHVEFNFDPDHFDGFWIDPEKDVELNINLIIFYLSGVTFVTPYLEETWKKFQEIIDNKGSYGCI